MTFGMMSGRTNERECGLPCLPAIARSTASMPAPAASRAISYDSGEVYVSGSSATARPGGAKKRLMITV